MSAGTGFYEQIKADLGYLHLDTAAGSFALLAEEARTNDWSHVEFLARLVAEQATADRNRRLAARLRYARFPYRRRIEDFDFEFQPSVDRKLVADLATLRFIEENRPILFLGQPGCGKTHLAVDWPPSPSRPATAATSPPPTPCARTSCAPTTTEP
jgi:DNA replication protein DnaC